MSNVGRGERPEMIVFGDLAYNIKLTNVEIVVSTTCGSTHAEVRIDGYKPIYLDKRVIQSVGIIPILYRHKVIDDNVDRKELCELDKLVSDMIRPVISSDMCKLTISEIVRVGEVHKLVPVADIIDGKLIPLKPLEQLLRREDEG